MACAVILDVVGDQLEMDLVPDSTANHAKHYIASEWGIPPECQVLTCGTTLLHGPECLISLCTDNGGQLSLLMVVKLDHILCDLNNGDQSTQFDALSTLEAFGRDPGSDVMAAVIAVLADDDTIVRESAADAVKQLTKHLTSSGARDAITSICRYLQHDNPDVRHTVALALASVAEYGDQDVINALYDLLEDECHYVRQSALESLAYLAPSGDQRLLTEMSRILACDADVEDTDYEPHEHTYTLVRAIHLCGEVVEKGDNSLFAAVSRHLYDGAGAVRTAAVETLGRMAERGSKQIINTLSMFLDDENWQVRSAVVRILGQVADRGDTEITAAAIAALQDQHMLVVAAAVVALGEVAEKGNEQVISAVTKVFEDFSRVLTATTALRSDLNTFSKVVVASIGDEADNHDPGVIFTTTSYLQGAASVIKWTAVERSDKLKHIMDALMVLQNLNYPKCTIRNFHDLDIVYIHSTSVEVPPVENEIDTCIIEAAVETLSKLTTKGDWRIIRAVSVLLGEDSDQVKEVVVGLLGGAA